MDAKGIVVFALLFLAVVAGYIIAIFRLSATKINRIPLPQFLENSIVGRLLGAGSPSNTPHLQERYREGLNSLINEQPDEAIDALTAALDISDDTFETHMSLGNMLRKRGEVDRAIRIRQNLLNKEGHLGSDNILAAHAALAEDYFTAGLYDRAEAIYNELSHSEHLPVVMQALERLVEVYQREGEWFEAVVVVDKIIGQLDGDAAIPWQQLQSHFYCEIAHVAIDEGRFDDARQALIMAAELDPELARVLILQGQLASQEGQNEQAFNCLRQVPLNFTAHNAQVLPLLIDTYHQLLKQNQDEKSSHHNGAELQNFLAQIYRKQPSVLLLPAMARALAQQEGEAIAVSFLVAEVQHWPRLAPIGDVLHLLPASSHDQLSFEPLLALLEQKLQSTQAYECQSCGYEGHEHHWQCPGCKTWGSIVSS